MSEFFKDPMGLYTVAFLIFVGLAYRYGRSGMLGWIDGEIQKVRSQLDDAKKLRDEAEKTLVEYKGRQAAALAEAEYLIRNAKEDAVRLKAQAEADLKASLARHEQQAAERIKIAEAEALSQVRQHAVDLAMKMAHQNLETKMQGDAASKLIDQAIADLPTTASKANKAA